MKEPRNYGPTPDELEEMRRQAEEARLKKEAEERAERDQKEAEESSDRKKRQDEWVRTHTGSAIGAGLNLLLLAYDTPRLCRAPPRASPVSRRPG